MKTWKANLFRIVQNKKVVLYLLGFRGLLLILTLAFISSQKKSAICWEIYWFASFLSEAVITLSKYGENIFQKNNIVTLIMANGTCFLYMVASFLYPLMIWWIGPTADTVPANFKSTLTFLFLIFVNWGAVYFLAEKTSEYCKNQIKGKEKNE